MQSGDPMQPQFEQLRGHLLRAAGALADDARSVQDALAITRNVAALVLAQVDLLSYSPTLSERGT